MAAAPTVLSFCGGTYALVVTLDEDLDLTGPDSRVLGVVFEEGLQEIPIRATMRPDGNLYREGSEILIAKENRDGIRVEYVVVRVLTPAVEPGS